MNKKWILAIAVLALAGCYYDNEEELYPNSVGSNTSTDTSAVSYATTIAPMMATNCTTSGCHEAGAQSPNLTTYQGVFNNRNLIKVRAVDGPNWMPSSGPMSASDRRSLGRWIDAGAPNN